MNAMKAFLSGLLLVASVGFSANLLADTGPNPYFTTEPSPPPVDQEFAAVLHIRANPGATGFWGEAHPQSRIDGNTITFLFDEGCGWICQFSDLQAREFPFTMPALSEGTYVVRFASDFSMTAQVYGEFVINVGNGLASPAPLPIGGQWDLMLAALLVLLAAARLLGTRSNRKAVD